MADDNLPPPVQQGLQLARLCLQHGRIDDAMRLCRGALDVVPVSDATLDVLRECLAAMPRGDAAAAGRLAGEADGIDEPLAAIERLGQAVALAPCDARIHFALGQRLSRIAQEREAEKYLACGVALARDSFDGHRLRGMNFISLGDNAAAIAALRRALTLRDDDGWVWGMLADVMMRQGSEDGDAIGRAVERSFALLGGGAAALALKGRDAQRRGDFAAAERCYEAACALAPGDPVPFQNAVAMFIDRGEAAKAVAWGRRLAALPVGHDVFLPFCTRLVSSGWTGQAAELLRLRLELGLANDREHSFLVWLVDHLKDATLADQQAERRRWQERQVDPLNLPTPRHANDRSPERPLRIGLVSGFFRQHSSVFGYGALLTHRDRDQFKLYCYSMTRQPDARTREIMAAVDGWTDVRALSDDAMAERIRADGIDILVDLDSHSWATNRLLVFARRPAPVQVTAWGYATGTGLAAIDYLISDRILVPDDEAPLYNEAIWHLPVMIGYADPVGAPPVGPLPALANGYVTFGSFSSIEKVTEGVVDAWSEILRAVPGARLAMKYFGLDQSPAKDQLHAAFAARGISPERLVLLGGTPWAEHMAAYGILDIGLDPFPHGGGITTMDALWMGVPVVAERGPTQPARNGASLLASVGMPEWVAANRRDYIDLAVRRAQDLPALAALRAGLRDKVAASPVASANYVKVVENAFREMWRKWCRVPHSGEGREIVAASRTAL